MRTVLEWMNMNHNRSAALERSVHRVQYFCQKIQTSQEEDISLKKGDTTKVKEEEFIFQKHFLKYSLTGSVQS